MNPIRSVLLTALASFAAFAQAPAPRLEFEVASVKPSVEADTPMGNITRGLHVDGAMVRYNGMPLKWYIRVAYRVKESQISGPDWIGTARFDISAKLPAGAKQDQIPDMLQSLLQDRFKLKLHRDTKEFSVYALVVAKGGAKIKESPLDADTDDGPGKANVDVNVAANQGGNGATVSLGKGASVSFEAQRLVAKKVTMAYLADSLTRFEDRPVVDMTNLTGTYDFTLDYNLDDVRALILSSAPPGTPLPPRQAEVGDTGVSLTDSLLAAGLRMEARKAPLEILVIDHVDKTATEN